MKYNKKEIIEGLKNNPSKTINDNLEIIKDKNVKIESRIFIINVLGRIDWYDTVSFYHLYKKNKRQIKKIKITFQEILNDESENDTVKIEIIKSFENNPLLFGPVDEEMIVLLEKIISDKYKNEDLRKCAQKTLDSIDSPYKKRKINYHPDVNYHKDSIILKDAIEKSINKLQKAIESINYMAKDYQNNFRPATRLSKKYFEDVKKLNEAIESINYMARDYQNNFRPATRLSKKYFEDVSKFQKAIESINYMAKDYQKNLQPINESYQKNSKDINKFQKAIESTSNMAKDYQKYFQLINESYQKNSKDINKLKSAIKMDEFIDALEYAEKIKKVIKDYEKK